MNLQPGARLGGYTIIERIGRGGMSTVYKAHQPSLSRQVAIKVLPPYFEDDEEVRRRFQQEALTVANLQHPNILVAYEYGEQDGMIYLVSELVDGGTLQEMVGSPQTVETVVRLLGPIAEALDFAHARGVLHRDVKPANILLRRDGTPVLSDFGLVRMLHSPSARLTRTGLTVGTPEYMAPEQGTSEAISAAADIYGLAVMAYELLTGRVPFRAETPMAVLLAHMQEQPAPPSELNGSLPRAINTVLLKALAKEPAARFGSATGFIEALEAAGRGEKPLEDSAAALRAIDTTMAAADKRAAVAAEVVAMVGTAAARRRLRSAMLSSGAVAAAVLAATIWAIAHNAGASSAAHHQAVRPIAPLTGTPRVDCSGDSCHRPGATVSGQRRPHPPSGYPAANVHQLRASGAVHEQAAVPVRPSATPSPTASRTATAVPTRSPTMITFPASDGGLPQAATATASPRPAPPTRTPARVPAVRATPKAIRPPAHRSASTARRSAPAARRATPAPRRAVGLPRRMPPPHNGTAREVSAAGGRPRQPTRQPTKPRPAPAPPRPTPPRPHPTPTATPLPAIPLIGHPPPRQTSTPHVARAPHRAAPARPKTAPRHHAPTPQLVLVGHRPMPVAHKPASHTATKATRSGHAATAGHAATRKTAGHRTKVTRARRRHTHRRPITRRHGSLTVTVKH